jgi:DNA-binding NarL/FixJ family response regulator
LRISEAAKAETRILRQACAPSGLDGVRGPAAVRTDMAVYGHAPGTAGVEVLACHHVRQLFAERFRLQLVGVAKSQTDGQRMLAVRDPDVVLIESDAAGREECDMAHWTREHVPHALVIMGLNASLDPDYEPRAHGLRVWLLKATPQRGDPDRAHADDDAEPDEERAPRYTRRRSESPAQRRIRCIRALKTLTRREFQVLEQVARGRSVIDAARALSLAPKTIDTHKTNLMAKLGIHDRVALARFAIREGLVSVWDE